ncbi:MAG: YkgJ family cysteine cluster protein [Planctomycetota bacterium]|jgi:hypothetical protein
MGLKLEKKADVSKDECLDCDGLCCSDLAIMITKPRTSTEKNNIKWYLHYDKVEIYIRHNMWYIVVKSKCMYLGRNNMCSKYRERSNRCRRHNPPDCEKFGSWYDKKFTTPEEFEEYLKSNGR